MGTNNTTQYRFTVIRIDQFTGPVEAGVQSAGAVLDSHRQRCRLCGRTGLGALGEGETRKYHIRKIGVSAAEGDVGDFRRGTRTVNAVHRIFDDTTRTEYGIPAAEAADLGSQHQTGCGEAIHATYKDRAAVLRTLIDYRTTIKKLYAIFIVLHIFSSKNVYYTYILNTPSIYCLRSFIKTFLISYRIVKPFTRLIIANVYQVYLRKL